MNSHRLNSSLVWKDIKRRIFPRGLSFTREGKIYVFVTLGLGFAAVNTGNNLLFLVLGLMLGLIIISGILSEIGVIGLEARRYLPERVEVGIPFPVELSLKNKKRWSSSFGIELRDEINGHPFRRRCFFLRVGPNEVRSVAYRCDLDQRGVAQFDGTIISTRFPFGLFEKKRFVRLRNSTIALPRRIDIDAPDPSSPLGKLGSQVSVAGSGPDFRELREMVPGDDPRKIHWRSSARMGVPMIRETEVESAGFLEVVLDSSAESNSTVALEQAERNISAASTIIRDLTAKGITVRLVTAPQGYLEASNRLEALPLLDHLALIDVIESLKVDPPVGSAHFSLLIGPRAKTVGIEHKVWVPLYFPGEHP